MDGKKKTKRKQNREVLVKNRETQIKKQEKKNNEIKERKREIVQVVNVR